MFLDVSEKVAGGVRDGVGVGHKGVAFFLDPFQLQGVALAEFRGRRGELGGLRVSFSSSVSSLHRLRGIRSGPTTYGWIFRRQFASLTDRMPDFIFVAALVADLLPFAR